MMKFEDLFSLKDKIAVITGGASGIGRAITLRLAGAGAKLAVIYHGSTDTALQLEAELKQNNHPYAFFRADLRKEDEIISAVRAIAEHFGSIHVLVNNAGVFGLSFQQDLDADGWDDVFGLNARGLFLITRECLAHLKRTGGNIVNISSINALHPGFGKTAHYDASKGAVEAYTRSLAAEVAPRGIRVNAVAPGLVDSSALRQHAAELAAGVEARTPLRKLAKGDDVARAVLFLASPAASHITGISVTVDGGYLLT